jgi:DNA-binding MarR family transcriptional regulator
LPAEVEAALATWPQIDPEVEGIISRIETASRQLDRVCAATLKQIGLNRQEFRVLMRLRDGPKTHGYLSRELLVSTGAMTNRLDKLERAGLLVRKRDPHDRRGVLLELTARGRETLDAYIEVEARREQQLLGALSDAERRELGELMARLIGSIQRNLPGVLAGDLPASET